MAKKPFNTTLRVKPVFMDGLTTTKTYLVLATQPGNPVYNCVAIRRFSDGSFKLKFYPNMEEWGFSTGALFDRGFTDHLTRVRQNGHSYDRFMGNVRQVNGVLNMLRERNDVACVPEAKLVAVYEDWDAAREDCIYADAEVPQAA